MTSCATAVCTVAAAPSRTLRAPVSVLAASQTNTPQTPAAVKPLLVQKAITAKPACEGQANKLHKKPFIIGVAGGTASGKSTMCRKIRRILGSRVALLKMDRFYSTPSRDKPITAHNFDVPDALDWQLFTDTLQKLIMGQSVQLPRYSFKLHQRLKARDTLKSAEIILVEGVFALHDPKIRDQFDFKVYVEADADVRLARRIQRDIAKRGRQMGEIIRQYLGAAKPAHELFIGPSSRHADIIVPWPDGPHNSKAIEMLVQHINTEVFKRGLAPQPPAETTAAGEKAVAVVPTKRQSL